MQLICKVLHTRIEAPLYLQRIKAISKWQIFSLYYFLDWLKKVLLLSTSLLMIQIACTTLIFLKNKSSIEKATAIKLEVFKYAILI